MRFCNPPHSESQWPDSPSTDRFGIQTGWSFQLLLQARASRTSVCIMRSPGCSRESRGSRLDRGGSTRPTARESEIDAAWHFINALASLSRGTSQRQAGLTIVSVSLTDAQLEQIRIRSPKGQSAPIMMAIGRPRDSGTKEPLRLYEAITLPFFARSLCKTTAQFPVRDAYTEDPRNSGSTKHRWLTELTISHYRLPRHYVLGERLMGSESFTQGRAHIIERPTYFCPSWIILGGPRRVIRASSFNTRTRADGEYSPLWLALLGCLARHLTKVSTQEMHVRSSAD